jgi:hypothetical protein
MKSLGYFRLEVPKTGARITAEKIQGPNGIIFQHGSIIFKENELREIGKAPDGIIPPPSTAPWA